jgi:hypothetical protein
MDGKRIDKVLVTPADEARSNPAEHANQFSNAPDFADKERGKD